VKYQDYKYFGSESTIKFEGVTEQPAQKQPAPAPVPTPRP